MVRHIHVPDLPSPRVHPLAFPDAKRPITIDLLRRLDLAAVARSLGRESMFDTFQKRASGRRTARPRTRHGSTRAFHLNSTKLIPRQAALPETQHVLPTHA